MPGLPQGVHRKDEKTGPERQGDRLFLHAGTGRTPPVRDAKAVCSGDGGDGDGCFAVAAGGYSREGAFRR